MRESGECRAGTAGLLLAARGSRLAACRAILAACREAGAACRAILAACRERVSIACIKERIRFRDTTGNKLFSIVILTVYDTEES